MKLMWPRQVLSRRRGRCLLLLLGASVLTPSCFALTNGLLFLKEPISARQAGLGDAFVAVDNDAAGFLANPGILDAFVYPEGTFLFKKGILDTSFTALSGIYPLRGWGTFGAAFTAFDGGTLELFELDPLFVPRTIKAEQDTMFDISHGLRLCDWFFYGINLKFIQTELAGYKASPMRFDLGWLSKWPMFLMEGQPLSVGYALRNQGGAVAYSKVMDIAQLYTNCGASLRVLDTSRDLLMVSIDDEMTEPGRPPNVRAGIQYAQKWFDVRLGLGDGKLYYGAGLKMFPHQLDYSYAPWVNLGTNLISYTYRFGSDDPLEIGDRYQEKDMTAAALSEWKKIGPNDPRFPRAQQRILRVEAPAAGEKQPIPAEKKDGDHDP